MLSETVVIEQTKKWIAEVVVGCNFCPFAARELRQNRIHYHVEWENIPVKCLQTLLEECTRLDNNSAIETTLIIFPESFRRLDDYLDLVALGEETLRQTGYEGDYQIASFHPNYLFEGSDDDDPANYTNRSPYPMLHLLREQSIELALEKYTDPNNIPERNIDFARKKGIAYMRALRDAVMK